MRLSVVVCTYDRYDVLHGALRGLAEQTLPKTEFEILVIDNSPDAKRSAAQSLKHNSIPNLTWVHETKAGLSNARNVGTARARGEIIAFLDDDAIPSPVWGTELLAAFDHFGPKTAVIGGKVVPLFMTERPTWLTDKLLNHLSMVDLGEERRLVAEGEWVVGANIAYRAEDLKETGGFSTNLGRIGNVGLLSAEETEIAAKLKARGLLTGYAPAVQVQHLVDTTRTSEAWFARRFAWQAVSAVLSGEFGSPADVETASLALRKYFAHLHPSDRHIGALLVDQSGSGELDWQLGTIFNLMIVLLVRGRFPSTAAA